MLNLERWWNSFSLRLLAVTALTLFTVTIMALPGGTPAVEELLLQHPGKGPESCGARADQGSIELLSGLTG